MRYTAGFVEAEYNNRAAVPDHPRWLARWTDTSAEVRASHPPVAELRYGPGAKETLDLFLPPRPARGTFVFIHGGWWRTLDKADHSFVVPPFLAEDIAVAVLNYDLCPAVSIATIVDETRRALEFVARTGSSHGANVARVVVGGHSAGGHLTAMMFATDWRARGFTHPPLTGGVSLSGVHDLRPMPLFSANVDLKLDADEAAALSPIDLAPSVDAPLLIAVGAAETREFVRQSQILWDAWPAQRPPSTTGILAVPGRHHFDVVFDYHDPRSALTRATLALFE